MKQPRNAQLWKVTGGSQQLGILVRSSCKLSSVPDRLRLDTGALVREVEIVGDRLHFDLVSGSGPSSGWVTLRVKDKNLLVKVTESPVYNTLPKQS